MIPKKKFYRILDVNFNRAGEGLRVIEDAVRFLLNDSFLTQQIKELRHCLLGKVNQLPDKEKLITYRNSQKDVGSKLKEASRGKLEDLITANFKRIEEAERSLEEYGKLTCPIWAEQIKSLRFQTYTLEKKVKIKLRKRWNFSLYVITDPLLIKEEELIKKIKVAIEAGATAVQLREKKSSSLVFLKKALALRKIIPPEVLFIINDRPDIAFGTKADGVHLGQEDLPVSLAREILGDDGIIGISTHSVEEAKRAEKDGADYIAIGPVFPTSTKPDVRSPLGVKIISQVKKEIKIPVVAIGGINKKNIREVLASGVNGIALISAIFASKNISLATKEFRQVIDEMKL